MTIARVALLAIVLVFVCGSAAAQSVTPKTFVQLDGHKLNVCVSGTAKPATRGSRASPRGCCRYKW
jgi:hypothetical protein